VDRPCIDALYAAAAAGVQVDLIVRGICCLIPDHENIRVVSIVGRFLEHSRVYSFRRDSERRYFMGSADLMPRNLDNRVELLVPVENEGLRRELDDTLERCLADDSNAWQLGGDGNWSRRTGRTRSVQVELMQRATSAVASD